ncbi:MAG: amylosucrase [Deltaproteobacteria bacterium SG8_13]|nr:MAG: amylosucrase [Deltaproteobacteria bacterium SG8_13]
MDRNEWLSGAARSSLSRLLPRLEKTYAPELVEMPVQWNHFKNRLNREWERLFNYLQQLYGWQYDFFYTLELILDLLIRYWLKRPASLRQLDEQREADPYWYLSEDMVGVVLYVDLFSNNLAGLHDHIPYIEQLGVTYLHLMPLFSVPRGENDGGYAVSDYRATNPDLGTMEELFELASALRERNISLVLDFVFNHTSDEHRWAQKAKDGDPEFMNYYLTFTDPVLVDRFQEHLRDIFPTVRKGSFTWNPAMQRWVWTTFNSYQWDLNYGNPAVFRDMAEEMLFLANQGIEVLRLDALAFIWKRLGTDCENQPEAHIIIRAFNAMARIVAPAMIFKSEAIVHPDEVIKYVHPQECQLSYNPLLMALLWEALATREVKLLVHSMRHRERLPYGCSWVNYLRCHDDIGWTFDDNDARQVGIDPQGHRKFLNDFYTGKFPGSFARGVPFQFNPDTGDLRISGTLSSLAGLEEALERKDNTMIERAVRRINMLRSIQVSIGGIPLLYAGDEYGALNDYTYLSDPVKVNDSRWVHRSRKRWKAADDLTDTETIEWRFYHEMVKLFQLRKSTPALRNGGMELVDTANPHLFAYIRGNREQRLLIINNFSEFTQIISADKLAEAGMTRDALEVLTQKVFPAGEDLELQGYRYMWIDISGPS